MPSFGLCEEHEINKMKMDSTGNQEASARVPSATNRRWDLEKIPSRSGLGFPILQ